MKIKSNSPQKSLWITCTQKKVNQVQHSPEHFGDQLHAEEGEDKVKLNPEHREAHLHAEEGEDGIKLPPTPERRRWQSLSPTQSKTS